MTSDVVGGRIIGKELQAVHPNFASLNPSKHRLPSVHPSTKLPHNLESPGKHLRPNIPKIIIVWHLLRKLESFVPMQLTLLATSINQCSSPSVVAMADNAYPLSRPGLNFTLFDLAGYLEVAISHLMCLGYACFSTATNSFVFFTTY